MTILICGASGLVGNELCKLCEYHKIKYFGTYNTAKIKKENMYKLNFFNIKEIEKFLQEKCIKICVFLIVQRLTDVCENSWDEIKKINIDMVNNISFICNKLNIRLIHLSTDYVFDGTKQPNFPNDLKNPLQNYGISKLLSELKVQSNCKDYCIIRTPVLYSNLSRIDDNAITLIAKNIMDLRGILKIEDHYNIRRPLYIADLCVFILYIIKNNLKGIYHFYNPYNKFTKYDICVKISNYLNLKYNNIIPNIVASSGIASRPYDTMLDDNKYNVYDFQFTEFDKSIGECFKKYKHPPINKINKDNFFILLDLDGTLINSNFAHYNAYKILFDKTNKKFLSFEEWKNYTNNKHFDEFLRENYNNIEIKNIKEEKLKIFKDQEITFTNNSNIFLEFLIDNNINCCIVTNTNQKAVNIIKEKLPIFKKINNWIVREDYTNPKPDSECYTLAKDNYYKNELYIIGIEDTNVGYKSLKNITDIIYLFTSETNHDFFKNDCYIFNDFNKLLNFN